VPQDDIVHRDLTVERALYYAAKLRLPSDFTAAQINQRIKEVLEDVDLTARRKATDQETLRGAAQACFYCSGIARQSQYLLSG